MITDEPVVLGSLDTPPIERVIRNHQAQFRYCYQKELNRNPELAGEVSVKFVIARDGTVSSARIHETTLGNAVVEECLLKRFDRLVFPQPEEGIVIVLYPFTFTPAT